MASVNTSYKKLLNAVEEYIDYCEINYIQGEAADMPPEWCTKAEEHIRKALNLRDSIKSLTLGNSGE